MASAVRYRGSNWPAGRKPSPNGQESPSIETAEEDFNVLGVQMPGFHDFGWAMQDPKGGTKSKGEA